MAGGDPFEGSIAQCIGVARELQRYCLPERSGPEMTVGGSRMLSYVRRCASDIDKVKIVRVPLLEEHEPQLRAALSLYEVGGKKTARIAFSSSLNRCWQRFVVCKELMHLLFDDATTRTPEALEQLSAMTLRVVGPGAKVESEVLAVFGAIEYLLPIDERPKTIRVDDPAEVLRIATQFRLPQLWVRFFYRNQANFKAVSDTYIVPPSVAAP